MGKTRSIRNKQQKFREITSAGALNIVSPPIPSRGIFFWNCPSLGWMDGWKGVISKWPCLGVSLSYSPLHLILFLFLSPNDMSWETKHTQVNQIKTHTQKEISSRLSSRTLIPPSWNTYCTRTVCVSYT